MIFNETLIESSYNSLSEITKSQISHSQAGGHRGNLRQHPFNQKLQEVGFFNIVTPSVTFSTLAPHLFTCLRIVSPKNSLEICVWHHHSCKAACCSYSGQDLNIVLKVYEENDVKAISETKIIYSIRCSRKTNSLPSLFLVFKTEEHYCS